MKIKYIRHIHKGADSELSMPQKQPTAIPELYIFYFWSLLSAKMPMNKGIQRG